MAAVGLEKFHSKAIILREPLNFCREVAAVQKVLSLLLRVFSSLSFFLMPKKTPLDQPVWASSEDHSIKIQLKSALNLRQLWKGWITRVGTHTPSALGT